MGWVEYALAMGLFLASHRVPAMLGLKARATAVLGPQGYVVAFSLISTALLVWVIAAAGRAPFVPLWDHAIWHRWAVNLAMPVAVTLAVFGTAAPNPFAFEGRREGFDPDRPGIAGLTRQPLLWAMAIWAAAHLLANGDLAHALLFGPFAVFSVMGMRMVEARRRREIGAARWQALTARTSLVPGAALIAGRWRPKGAPPVLRLALTVVIWAAVWHLHAPVIGVSPAP